MRFPNVKLSRTHLILILVLSVGGTVAVGVFGNNDEGDPETEEQGVYPFRK